MPRQNRVTPFGEIVAISDRGTFMGNRGVLHDAEGRIMRKWQVKRWLVCVLEFRGRKRTVMTPNRYTELFFLDEATALAAGHRPCAECRHARFLAFRAAWNAAHPQDGSPPSADAIDRRLHAERLTSERAKRTYTAALDELPDGAFVTLGNEQQQAYLLWKGRLLAWSPSGYAARRMPSKNRRVRVLTPPASVGAIRSGYIPAVHPSAER